MPTIDEEPLETIHLYVVREEAARPSLLPVFLALSALSALLVLCTLSPLQQPEEELAIRVPAVFLPLKSFAASVRVIPTGIKSYPAEQAHGTLTITNGSILATELPKGLILTGKDGVEVVTDAAVFVPAGSADGYGFATVSAHAAVSGVSGNIAPYQIDSVENSSIYIRNLHPFTGGKDEYSVTVETTQDRQTATNAARTSLAAQVAMSHAILAYPCKETAQEKSSVLWLSWVCQFVGFKPPPNAQVLSARLVGRTVVLQIRMAYTPRKIFPGK